MSKSSKHARVRADREGGVYSSSIPWGDSEYSNVYSREARTYLHGPGGGFVQADSRSTIVQGPNDVWAAASEWGPPDDLDFALDQDSTLNDEAVEADWEDVMKDPEPVPPPKKKRKRSVMAKRPHRVWKELRRSTYLDELCRFAGRGDFRTSLQCPDCLSLKRENVGVAEYRCDSDCFLTDLTCKSCCVRRHRRHPFHRIQKWEATHFVPVSLKSLGLQIVLNHASMYCENPTPCHKSMLILHTNGFHEVDLQYCGCGKGEPQHIQLLRRRLYPASHVSIKTCATFELLELLHKLALTTKSSTYDFHRALEMLTDNTGVTQLRSRYRELFRMILQWRHLKLLLWGGRAHDVGGPDQTKPGELAILCPSCPRPGVNLPEGWEKTPDSMKFLYMLFIAMDANFRLKNQIVSNYDQDPGLGIGLAYMIGLEKYEAFVLDRANDSDVSSCVGFQALAQANTRFSRGLRYTGVGGVFCGRSEMVLPQAVGNLMKGERYSNMDFIFGSAIQDLKSLFLILISYDISCQWFTNLHKRMEDSDWPEEFRIPSSTKLTPAVPKLHEPMHETKDHEVYSLNFIPGCGLSDMECPERFWAGHNGVGNATKTQGPGSRHDVLDDHFNFWNWLKYTSIGATLLRKYRAALADRNMQTEAHRGLTESLAPSLVMRWSNMCSEWEKDPLPKKKPNPYVTDGAEMTEVEAKKELDRQEKKRLSEGGVELHSTSPVDFIEMALSIGDSQRRLRRFAKGEVAVATAGQEGGLAEQRKQLAERISAWEELLPIYIPGLQQYRRQLEAEGRDSLRPEVNPENRLLWLPSQIRQSSRTAACTLGLPELEEKRRLAQCSGSLENLRLTLRIKSRLVNFKGKNIRGQRSSTRSRAIIDRVHERARLEAARYRDGRAALLALCGEGDWGKRFRVLLDSDIRSYQEPKPLKEKTGRPGTLTDEQLEMGQGHSELPAQTDDFTLFTQERDREDGTGETRKEVSWIWLGQGASQKGGDEDVLLRAEWAKSRARVDRAKEEVMLLKEEMRRVLLSLEWKAKWWLERSSSRTQGIESGLREGLIAFAIRSANLQRSLAIKFRNQWTSPLKKFMPADIAICPNGTILELVNGKQVQPTAGRDGDVDIDEDDETDEEDEVGEPEVELLRAYLSDDDEDDQ